jgi:hypothetical protein
MSSALHAPREVDNDAFFLQRIGRFLSRLVGHFTPQFSEMKIHATGLGIVGGQSIAMAIIGFFQTRTSGGGLAGRLGKIADTGHRAHNVMRRLFVACGA